MPGKKSYKCFLCPRITKRTDRFAISKSHRLVVNRISGRTPSDGDFLCNKCRHVCKSYVKGSEKAKKKVQACTSSTCTPQPSVTPVSPPSVQLPFPSSARGHSSCCICKRPGPKLIVVPVDIRHQIFISKEIIIPAGARCCPNHLHGNIGDLEPTADTTTVNKSTITQLIKFLRSEIQRQEKTRLDFNSEKTLSDAEYRDLMGISKDSFKDLLLFVEGKVRPTPTRSVRTSLAIFLMKLRGGESNRVLSTLFNVSKSSIRRCISSVRSALSGRFVHENLGFQHISRAEIIQHHTRQIAQTLFETCPGNQAILVMDGTYIYINKSGNFQSQRQSYSLHKGRPLVKPLIIVSTTGYYLSVMGPYLARNNDASILKHVMKSNIEDICNWVEKDDIFVVDRGFRDSLDFLEELGIQAHMPSFMSKGEKQMTTESANTSRLVTKIRWVVESANSRIKQWKYLQHVLPTSQIPYIGDFIRIVCAICNRYMKPLSNGNATEDESLGCKMLFLSKQVNALQQHVEEHHLDRRSVCWEPVDDLKGFPYLDEEQLRNLTCGIYQLRLSPSYAQEHLEGNCQIHVHKEEPGLVRVRLQSRHVSSRSYQLWIRYDEASVTAWYCKCRAGARVVGMCSHIAAILWLLGNARHRISSGFGVRNWGDFVDDANNIPTPVDESESSEGELSGTEE